MLLNIYCQEDGKVIYLTGSKLPRCEFLTEGKDLLCFSSFPDRADDGEATTLESGGCGGMWV